MAEKQVTVVINGEEYVSKAAGEADTALGGFSNKIPGYAKTIAALTVAFQVVQAAIGKVRDVVVESFAAYDELETSQRKLEGTAKLTGLSLDFLSGIAEKGRKEFGLSRVQANDYATEVGKLAVKSGDASKATELLAGFLNIGAAKGLSAAESLQKASQAILGVDEGTDALFGVNPSALWAEYATVIGKSASKFTEQEKAAALAHAVLEGGQKVVGSYAEFLDSAQGKQAMLNTQIQETKAKLGEAMQPLRTFAVDAMGQLLQNSGQGVSAIGALTQALVAFLAALSPIVQPLLTVGTVLLQVFSVGAEQVIISVRRLSGATAVAVGQMIGAFGELAERGGKFLKLLGIDVVADTGRRMREFGEDMVATNQNKLLKVEYDALGFKDRQKALWAGWKGETVKAAHDTGTGIEQAITTATPKVAEAAGKMGTDVKDRLGEPLKIAIGLTEGALVRLGEAATHQLPTAQSEKFLTHMQGLVAASGDARDKIMGIGDNTKRGADTTKDMAREVETVARGAIDAATSFGVIDDAAARSLNSAVNIASAVGSMAKNGFSFSGAVGIIGGVASIVGSMMAGDAERKRLLAANNVELARLRDEIGNLSLDVSGEDFLGVQDALAEVLPKLRGGRGAANQADVINALAKRGLTFNDLKKLADQLGIKITTESGAMSVDGLRQLFEAMGLVEIGQFGQDFGSQLESTQSGFGVRGTSDIDQIGALGNLGGQFSSALRGIVDLNDLPGTRARLAALFERLNNGGVSAAELGGLTGTQFLDLITNLIGRIDNLQPSTGGGGDVVVPDGTGGGTGTGGATVPTETIQAVIKAMDANLAEILTSHTTLHERIAVATEGSYAELQQINGKMDTLIAVSSGTDRTDVQLEEMRYLLRVQQGAGVAF
jgi:hypothetical protein